MRGVDAVVDLHDAGQLDQLVGRGVAARRVDEPGREPEGAGRHARRQQPLHGGQLADAGRALVETHRSDPQGAVTDEGGDVDGAAARLDGVEVLGERAPGHRAAVEVALPHGHEVAQPAVVDRRRRHAAVAHHVSGDALVDRRLGAGVTEHGEVGVGVRVDKAGRHVAPAHVDHDRRGATASRQRARGADGRHLVALDQHVGRDPGVAGSVDQTAVGEDDAPGQATAGAHGRTRPPDRHRRPGCSRPGGHRRLAMPCLVRCLSTATPPDVRARPADGPAIYQRPGRCQAGRASDAKRDGLRSAALGKSPLERGVSAAVVRQRNRPIPRRRL